MSSHREYMPSRLRINVWEDIASHIQELERSRPRTRDGLVEFIHHYSDLLSLYDEDEKRKELSHERDTSDIAAKIALEETIANIRPRMESCIARIDRRIVEHRAFPTLGRDPHYGLLASMFRRNAGEDRESCLPIQTEIERIEQRCDELLSIQQEHGSWELNTTDREERRGAWLAIQKEQEYIRDQIDAYFTALVELRHQLSRRAGYKNYRRYEHYGSHPRHQNKAAAHCIADAAKFHRAVEQHVVPLASAITHRHRKRLGLEGKILRPWDTDASFFGFQAPSADEGNAAEEIVAATQEEFVEKAGGIVGALHPSFGQEIRRMQKKGLLDLESRPHKMAGAFCQSLEARRLPFVFMNSAATHNNLITFTHEAGHALHICAMSKEPLIFYRFYGADLTLLETMSETMELLGSTQWNCGSPEATRIARRNYLEECVRFLPWAATIDKFQQWLYEHPHCSPAERDGYFAHLMQRFYPRDINWRGIEKYRKKYWQQSGHILTSPFYYIQYAFARLAAIEMYQHYQRDPEGTIGRFLQGMRHGASKPYPAVWREMDISFDFSPKGFDAALRKIPELMGFVMQEIEKLDEEIKHAI